MKPELHLGSVICGLAAPLCQAYAEQEQILREAEEAKQKACSFAPKAQLLCVLSKALNTLCLAGSRVRQRVCACMSSVPSANRNTLTSMPCEKNRQIDHVMAIAFGNFT